jgi:NAD(P)-dependent dehydrogenase (short-subunit alcohol dehydrogenase family)
VSRSDSPLEDGAYRHVVARVQDEGFAARLDELLDDHGVPDVCVYCAGIGELLDPVRMDGEVEVFAVNLVGMVRTAGRVVPRMIERGEGHFVGLSSVADALLSAEAPSYHASKAAFSNYLEGLALALRPRGVRVTNVRFGFVDTKMAKGDRKPFIMSADRAARHVVQCIEKKPVRYTAPRIVVPFVALRAAALRLANARARFA